jgi:hypothetical protein
MVPIHHLVALKHVLPYLGNEDLASVMLVHSSLTGTATQTLYDVRGADFKPTRRKTTATNVTKTKVASVTVDQAVETGDLETCKAKCTRTKAVRHFFEACGCGHLHLAKWLVVTFNLTGEDARSWDKEAFRWACNSGHLHVARWLVATFNLTGEDARTQNNNALRMARKNSYTHVVEWLNDTFGIVL